MLGILNKGQMMKKKIGYYDYTVILTYCGMLSAFCGIFLSIGEHYLDAVFCLMLAGVCDMFDGAVANTKKRTIQEKRFGIQIDSLSDLISFGVLPAVFAYMMSERTAWCGIIAAVYALCGLIRLAYYNVTEEERQQVETGCRETFLGIPITSIAILLPAAFVLYSFEILKSNFGFVVLLVVTGIGFITPVEVKKPKLIGKICLCLIGLIECAGMVVLLVIGG